MNNNNNFQPILLGSDINAYGVARSFHEKYNKISLILTERQLSPTKYSKILKIFIFKNLNKDNFFIKNINFFLKKINNKKKLLLIPCSDNYSRLISKFEKQLKKNFIFSCINIKKFNFLSNKKNFYQLCNKFNINFPKTIYINKNSNLNKLKIIFPIILKPANSILYNFIKFKNKQKIFFIKNKKQLINIIKNIYNTNYSSELIIQDIIPGDDSNMLVLNAYVNKNHKVKIMCLGRILLEDHSAQNIGNYLAILPEYNKNIYNKIKFFLEKINYKGFANFDIKYDYRYNKYNFFEINLRQGRSSFYLTLNNYNISTYIVEDLIYNNLENNIIYGNGNKLWLNIPKYLFYKYTQNNKYKKKAILLIKQKKNGSTLEYYKRDFSIMRFILIKYIFYKYFQNFKKNFII